MKNRDTLVKSAAAAFLVLTSVSASATSVDDASAASEKCYGLVKAGMNDCATATASCAGSAKQDKQPDAFVFMPVGLCNKLVGGSLSATKPSQKNTQ